MSLVYIIEDDQIMADCLALAVGGVTETAPDGTTSVPDVMIFNDAISAIDSIDEALPDVILLDVMLSGPDGFTFLNELVSYHDTAQIPVALITSLDLENRNFEHYSVFRILNKRTMTPADVQAATYDGISLSRARRAPEAAVLPELVPDQPIVEQIEQFSPQTVENLDAAIQAELVPEAAAPEVADLSPEALAVIHGDVSTAMDAVLGMPPTNIDADTEPTTLSEPGALEDPAEPIDYLETSQDGDSF